MKKRWTACTYFGNGAIEAQCKSSKKELMDRLLADDDIWINAKFVYKKAFDKKHFHRGMTILFSPDTR